MNATLKRLRLRMALAMLAAIIIAAFGSAPATLAAVGSDSHGSQALCRYGEIDPADTNGSTGMRLRRMVVLPPTLYSRYPDQTVGWKFVMQRRYSDLTTYGPWKRIYASDIQTAVAQPDAAATFISMSARIGFIHGIDRWPNGYNTVFRVIVTFYWYDDAGIEASQRFLIGEYPSYRNGVYQFTSYGNCEGAWLDG